METAIGVFAARDRAAEAVQELLRSGVPEDSIVFLTRSETDAQTVGKQFGAYAGGVIEGAEGMSAGAAAAVFFRLPASVRYLLWALAVLRCWVWSALAPA